MPSAPSRGPITSRIVDELGRTDFPVGDNAAPDDPYGWQGQPDQDGSTFIPWLSVTPTTAMPQAPSGGLGDTGTEWRMNYNVFVAGISRKQSEALADRARNSLTNISREKIETPTGDWKIQKITCTGVGSNNRVASGYPDYFTQSDNYEVWISKG